MNSRDHGLISVALALGIVWLGPPPAEAIAVQPASVVLVLGVVALGVAIDLDHFLLARLRTGSWRHTRRVLADPRLALFDQADIFETGDVWREDRLCSHLLVGGVLVTGLWVWSAPYLAFVVGLTVYVHVLADVYHDRRTRDQYLLEGARVVSERNSVAGWSGKEEPSGPHRGGSR